MACQWQQVVEMLAFAMTIFVGCIDTSIPAADASFIIQKDTVINGAKSRVEVSVVDTSTNVFFIYKGTSTFNSVWPGDSVLTSTTIRKSVTDSYKGVLVKYYILQDYNTRQDSVVLSAPLLKALKDSFLIQVALKYQGIALPSGTTELAYKFRSYGNLKVTWVARNANGNNETDENIVQKMITVKKL